MPNIGGSGAQHRGVRCPLYELRGSSQIGGASLARHRPKLPQVTTRFTTDTWAEIGRNQFGPQFGGFTSCGLLVTELIILARSFLISLPAVYEYHHTPPPGEISLSTNQGPSAHDGLFIDQSETIAVSFQLSHEDIANHISANQSLDQSQGLIQTLQRVGDWVYKQR